MIRSIFDFITFVVTTVISILLVAVMIPVHLAFLALYIFIFFPIMLVFQALAMLVLALKG